MYCHAGAPSCPAAAATHKTGVSFNKNSLKKTRQPCCRAAAVVGRWARNVCPRLLHGLCTETPTPISQLGIGTNERTKGTFLATTATSIALIYSKHQQRSKHSCLLNPLAEKRATVSAKKVSPSRMRHSGSYCLMSVPSEGHCPIPVGKK